MAVIPAPQVSKIVNDVKAKTAEANPPPGVGGFDTSGSFASPGPASTTGGVVNSANTPKVGSEAEPFPAAAKPTTSQVDAPTETVEDRLNALTAKDSKYIDLARNDAMREANTRGLINSSMAAGAGTEAGIRAALPIAQQDAKTYTDTRLNNQAATNQFEENRQLTELGKETSTHENTLATARDASQNELGIERDTAQSELRQKEDESRAALNNETDALRSILAKEEEAWSREVQTKMELVLADENISNDMKMSYVTTIKDITIQAAQDINAISLGGGTATQQAAAIKRIEEVRDANIAVYENLLKSSPAWDWGSNFTSNPPPVSSFSGPAAGSESAAGTESTSFGSQGVNLDGAEFGPGTANDIWQTDPATGASGWGNANGLIDNSGAGYYPATSANGSSMPSVYFDAAGNSSIPGATKAPTDGSGAGGYYVEPLDTWKPTTVDPAKEELKPNPNGYTYPSAEAAEQYRADLVAWHEGGMVGPQPNNENYWDSK